MLVTDYALTVPTRGDRPYLPRIVAAAQCPVVIVNTGPRRMLVPGATVVADRGPINIHRWWNRGIDAAGARHVAVFNDDVTFEPGLIRQMSEQLDETGAAVCWTRRVPDGQIPMTGWAFMLDTASGVRPDERFRWWFGDNDLYVQAERAGGWTSVPVSVMHHHPNETTEADPALQALALADQATFAAKWARV
jgi:hypothetical protein